MAERIDHLVNMRAPAEPPAVLDADAPRVSLDLVDHLMARFPPMEPTAVSGLDHSIVLLSKLAERSGQLAVISYLRSLAQGSAPGVHS